MHEPATYNRESDPKSRTPEFRKGSFVKPHHAKAWQQPPAAGVAQSPPGREAAPPIDKVGEVDRIIKAAANIRSAIHTDAGPTAATTRFELSKIERAAENLKREES